MTTSPHIAAALCWYDEAPDMLARCLASLAGFADLIVSLDGPYAHFPHEERRSTDEQRHAIDVAARAARIPHVSLMPDALLPTQAGKRTRLYRAAANRAGPDGWILIVDADETLTGDMAAARGEIAGMMHGFDSATVLVRTGTALASHPRLLRSMPSLTCGPEYHGMLSGTDIGGRRVCIRDRREIIMNEHPRPRRAREIDLSRILTLTNDNDNRPSDRKAAKLEYVRRRMAAGIDL